MRNFAGILLLVLHIGCSNTTEPFEPVVASGLEISSGNCFDPDSSCLFGTVDSIYYDFPGNLSTLWSHINTNIEYSSFGERTPRYSVVTCKIIAGTGLGWTFVGSGFKTHFEGYLLRGRTYKIEAFYEFKEDDKIYRSSVSEPFIVVIPL